MHPRGEGDIANLGFGNGMDVSQTKEGQKLVLWRKAKVFLGV